MLPMLYLLQELAAHLSLAGPLASLQLSVNSEGDLLGCAECVYVNLLAADEVGSMIDASTAIATVLLFSCQCTALYPR